MSLFQGGDRQTRSPREPTSNEMTLIKILIENKKHEIGFSLPLGNRKKRTNHNPPRCQWNESSSVNFRSHLGGKIQSNELIVWACACSQSAHVNTITTISTVSSLCA